jgi:hypothetical protein
MICGQKQQNKVKIKRSISKMANSLDGASDVSESMKKRDVNFKKFFIPAVLIVVFIVITTVLAVFPKPFRYNRYKMRTIISQTGERVAILPGGENKVYIDGRLKNQVFNSDSSKTAFRLYDKNGDNGSSFSLYLFDGKPQFIDDKVIRYQISELGNAVAYLKEYDTNEGKAELWLYSGGEKTLIAKENFGKYYFFFSPDGSAICYSVYDGEDYTGYVWDGNVHELMKNCVPFAVADGAKYVYYVSTHGAVYVQKGKDNEDSVKIADRVGDFRLIANKDVSQVIIDLGNECYIIVNGEVTEKLSDNTRERITPVTPYSTSQRKYRIFYDSYDLINMAPNMDYISSLNFANSFYRAGTGDLIHINNKYKADIIAESAEFAYLSDDAKTLTYMQDENIYRLNAASKFAKPKMIVSGDILSFVAVSDGSAIFYLTENNKLYYQKGRGKPVLVSDNIQSDLIWRRYWEGKMFAGKTIYYTSGGELYHSSGEKGKPVSGIEGEIVSVSAGLYETLVNTKENGESFLYYSTDGVNFSLID